MKTCTKCNTKKHLDEFYDTKYTLKDGTVVPCKQSRCKTCSKEYSNQYFRTKRKRFSVLSEGSKVCAMCETEKPLTKYYPNRIYSDGRARVCKTCTVRSTREWIDNKMAEDPAYRLRHTLSSTLSQAIVNNWSTTTEALEALGCDIQTAREHLEKQFKPGMTWENHGMYGWNIDHIEPISSFDLSDPEQVKKCFNYKNTQPLWVEEHKIKGSVPTDVSFHLYQ